MRALYRSTEGLKFIAGSREITGTAKQYAEVLTMRMHRLVQLTLVHSDYAGEIYGPMNQCIRRSRRRLCLNQS